MRRQGPVWQLTFAGREATVPHTKGLADIARCSPRRRRDPRARAHRRGPDRSGSAGDVVDRQALDAYRQRLADLDADVDDADRDNDPERRARAEVERQALLDELGRVTGARRPAPPVRQPPRRAGPQGGRADGCATPSASSSPCTPSSPPTSTRTVVTGTYCRYRATDTVWEVSGSER